VQCALSRSPPGSPFYLWTKKSEDRSPTLGGLKMRSGVLYDKFMH